MVHDPRVTTLLSRLGGLYRDLPRVDRDASSLLRSSVGEHLTPGIAPLVENNGDTSNCLVLQGTIAIVYRGTTYQLLVDIYLPPGYPIRPPISYIRLAPNMFLKENHPHVGNDGMVFMPYLHEWNSRTHNLIAMVVAMSSVFSAAPPVFTRKTAPPPPPPPPPPPQPRASPPTYAPYMAGITPYVGSTSSGGGGNSYYQPGGGSTNLNTSTDSERYVQEQIEAILAKEAAEANAAAEAARRAEQEEKEREREREQQSLAQKRLEQTQLAQLKDQVNQKLHAYLYNKAQEAKDMVQTDWKDQQMMKLYSKERIAKEMNQLEKSVQTLEAAMATVDSKTSEIQAWLDEAHNNNNNNGESAAVDELVRPASKWHGQMLDLAAENAAITDALYFLDRAMYMGHMDCTTHLKSVRKLAKRQFLVRAHLRKIQSVVVGAGVGGRQ